MVMVFRRRIECFVTAKLLALLLLAVMLAGCSARPGDRPISADCEWSEEGSNSLNLKNAADQAHLRYDSLIAEDMAIRWADKYAGPGFGQSPEYRRRRDACMEALFHGVASHHGVDVALVRQYRLSRDVVLDAVVIVSFGILYAVVAYYLTGLIRRRFPPDEWVAFLIATIAMSLVATIVGVLVGDLWSLLMENLRMGSGHLSYRVDRIPWRQHWSELFVCGVLIFWLVGAVRSRIGIRDNSSASFLGS